METVSSGLSLPTSSRKADFSSGSLSGSSIEPDTSIRNTRLAFGCSAGFTSKPLIATCISLVRPFQGVGMTVTVELNGVEAESGPFQP